MTDLARNWSEWIERPLPEGLSVTGYEGPPPVPFWVWCPMGDPEGGDILFWADRPPAVCLWDHPLGRVVLARGPLGHPWVRTFPQDAMYLGALRPLSHPVTHAEAQPAWT